MTDHPDPAVHGANVLADELAASGRTTLGDLLSERWEQATPEQRVEARRYWDRHAADCARIEAACAASEDCLNLYPDEHPCEDWDRPDIDCYCRCHEVARQVNAERRQRGEVEL